MLRGPARNRERGKSGTRTRKVKALADVRPPPTYDYAQFWRENRQIAREPSIYERDRVG